MDKNEIEKTVAPMVAVIVATIAQAKSFEELNAMLDEVMPAFFKASGITQEEAVSFLMRME